MLHRSSLFNDSAFKEREPITKLCGQSGNSHHQASLQGISMAMVMPTPMAITPPCLSAHKRSTRWAIVKPASTSASVSNPKVAMSSWYGYGTSRLQNSIMWFVEGRRLEGKGFQKRRGMRAFMEDTKLISEDDQEQRPDVSVVTQSDKLTMFFKAEGTLADILVKKVTQTLEALEGVSDVKVDILEGIATIELTKQTTAQATGVASELVEIIQGLDFKLQSLSLSFEDEEDE